MAVYFSSFLVRRIFVNVKPVSVFFTPIYWFNHNASTQSTMCRKPVVVSARVSRAKLLLDAGCGFIFGFMLYASYCEADKSEINEVNNRPNSASGHLKKLGKVSPTETFNFIADVAERVAPTVVYIETAGSHPLLGRAILPLSNGSGFIVRSDGLILTNAHVVADKPIVTVKLHDGRTFKGTVEDIDFEVDLATVRINAKNLPVLPLGKSSSIRLGEFVVALGNPLSLRHTITAGVVSAPHRPSQELGLRKECDYIQTDAAINCGNSGGPLVNLNGEAIGINTIKVTEGISFAIPSDHAAEFLKKVESKREGWWPFKKTKETVEGKPKYIGITMLTLTSALIQELRERNPGFPPVSYGVLIWRVISGSPAYESGLLPGDIIVRINNVEIHSSTDVYRVLEKEDFLKIGIMRGQTAMNIHVRPQVPPG